MPAAFQDAAGVFFIYAAGKYASGTYALGLADAG